MTELKTLAELWPILAALGALVAWVFGLMHAVKSQSEAIKRNEVDIAELKAKHEAEVSKLFEQLSLVKESLARIEGALGVKMERV